MTTKRSILILSSSHLCRNPRVLKEATTLAEAGYEVTVLSVSSHPVYEQVDRELMRSRPFRRITLDYTASNLRTRCAHVSQRLGTRIARLLCARLGIETAASLGPARALRQQARRLPVDLTIAHTEIPLWIAQEMIKDGRRVAVDLEDWYSEDLLPADRRHRPVNLLRQAEQFVLRHASYVSVPSPVMANVLHSIHGGNRPVILHNSFPLQPDPRKSSAADPAAPGFIWFSQTLGPGRGLEEFLHAWGGTSSPSSVILVGEDRHGYRETLRARVPQSHQTRMSFHDLVPPDSLPGLIARHDIGLALETPLNRNRDLAVTNKILQYLNAGLAVVATPTAGQREVLAHGPEAGVFLGNDAAANARLLDELLSDRARLQARQQAARRLAETRYCWEHDRQTLLDLVNKALSS